MGYFRKTCCLRLQDQPFDFQSQLLIVLAAEVIFSDRLYENSAFEIE